MKRALLVAAAAALAVIATTSTAAAEQCCCCLDKKPKPPVAVSCATMTIGQTDFQWAMAHKGGWVADAWGHTFPTRRFTTPSGRVCQPPTGGDMSYCGRVTGTLYKVTGSRHGPPRFVLERCKGF